MAAILEFVRSESAVFDPETVQVLASALDDAWARIEKAGSRFARPAYSRVMREVVAKRIIDMAQRGVTDQEKLAADAGLKEQVRAVAPKSARTAKNLFCSMRYWQGGSFSSASMN